ncbi:MAG: hypothetical protein V1659_04730 [Candidatus Woesearchaeota archaeon]
MGLDNIREKSGSVLKGLFGGLSGLEFLTELLSADRERIDFDSPIELGTYKLVIDVERGNVKTGFTLPIESFMRVERLLRQIDFEGFKKGVREGMVYAHEYLRNPQFVSFLADYNQGVTRQQEKEWSNDVHASKRDEVQTQLSRTLAHLSAAQSHLYNRAKQRKENIALEELFAKIDTELIPHFKREGKI